jgi:hypothetical protein
MIKYHNVEQGSEEWFDIRKGKMTGSNATPIGANGKGLVTYCQKIVTEMVAKERVETYINKDMERGNELETIGDAAYEFETSQIVDSIGFVTNDKYEGVGVSPDGLVGLDGGTEVKARNDEKHMALIQGETKEIPFNQIQLCLLITERKWWDFISINTNFDKPLFIKRIYPDLEYFEKLKKGFIKGRELIKINLETYNNYKN